MSFSTLLVANRGEIARRVIRGAHAMGIRCIAVYVDADANQGWESPGWTVTMLRPYARFDNLSIEQPLPYDDLPGAAHVRRHAGVPVILDESVWSARAMMAIVRARACDRIVLAPFPPLLGVSWG